MPTIYFEFVVSGPPLSVNTKKSQPRKHRKWQDTIAQAAVNQWAADARDTTLLPTKAPAEVVITTYFTLQPLDVDNVIKPILDSLRQVIYEDDIQIYKLTSIRVDLAPKPIIEDRRTLLIEALKNNRELVHIEVTWEE